MVGLERGQHRCQSRCAAWTIRQRTHTESKKGSEFQANIGLRGRYISAGGPVDRVLTEVKHGRRHLRPLQCREKTLTFHVQDNSGFDMPNRVSGIADVLARVLLGHLRDDECIAFQPMLPGQWGA